MEIAWYVVLILFLIALVMGWQWSAARSAVGKVRAELDNAAKRVKDAEARSESAERDCRAAKDAASSLAVRLKNLESAQETGGFDADHIYKLLAKGQVESADGERAYGVVQEDSGSVRPFLTDAAVDHLAVGDCFGIVRGKLARLEESEFKVASVDGPSGEPSRDSSAAQVTEMRQAPELNADTGVSVSASNAPQETALFVAPAPEQPGDPNEGLPYLEVDGGDEASEVHYLAFDSLTAGRDPGNDIVLQDENASRKHFTVSFTANRFLLEDHNSTNGTFCNGEKLSRKWLEFGDSVQVGDTTIRFSCEGYDAKDEDPVQAVAALEKCVERQPDFIDALKLLAFMLERNVARRKEAASHWERIARLEGAS